MKNTLFLGFLAILVGFSACKKDETPEAIDYDYHAHVDAPTATDYVMNDTLHMMVNFESHTMEIVHNIEVKILKTSDNSEIYHMHMHAHDHSGSHEFHEHLAMTAANGFEADADYTFQASVWGENDMEGLESETVLFHVNPQ